MVLHDISNKNIAARKKKTTLDRLRGVAKVPKPVIRRYADFDLVRRLGSGSFGLVYESIDVREREVALKIVQIENLKSVSKTLEPIQVESECWRLCNGHRNIVRLFKCGKVSSTFFFSMEPAFTDIFALVDATGDRKGRLPERLVKCLVYQAFNGILFMHSLGIIHRDVKPDNMLLSADGRLLLSDFGWSKILPLGRSTRTRGGTAEYLAPEVFTHGKYGHSVDLWALGMCMYEWIVGNNYLISKMKGEERDCYSRKMEFLENHTRLFPRCSRSMELSCSGCSQAANAVIKSLLNTDPSCRLGFHEKDPLSVLPELELMAFFRDMKQASRIPLQDLKKTTSVRKPENAGKVGRDMEKLDDWLNTELPTKYDDLFADFEWSAEEFSDKVSDQNQMQQPVANCEQASDAIRLGQATERHDRWQRRAEMRSTESVKDSTFDSACDWRARIIPSGSAGEEQPQYFMPLSDVRVLRKRTQFTTSTANAAMAMTAPKSPQVFPCWQRKRGLREEARDWAGRDAPVRKAGRFDHWFTN